MISKTEKQFVKFYSWLGILVVSLSSIPLHFLYDWLGENAAIGMFAPINESIWEHLKLVFWPLLLWWGIGYLLFRNKKNLSLTKWLTAGSVSIFISMIFIVSWYYTWTGGFDIHSSIIDIGSLFIAVPIAQLIGIHIYRVIESRSIYMISSILFLLAFIGMFIFFSFSTPNFPIFVPPN